MITLHWLCRMLLESTAHVHKLCDWPGIHAFEK